MSEWKPIDTAPKARGTRIIGWCKFPAGQEVRIIENSPAYMSDPEAVLWEAYGCPQDVTHWMPLPDAPHED